MTEKKAINIVSKYIKIYGLSSLKQTIYIMGTCQSLWPYTKYPNWTDFIKAKQKNSKNFSSRGIYEGYYTCRDTMEEIEYQVNNVEFCKRYIWHKGMIATI